METRTERGTSLDRKKRMQFWKMFESSYHLLKERQIRDINTAMYECRLLVAFDSTRTRYTDVISEQESLIAERCLLYMALTRAQKDTYISGYGQMSEFLSL